MYTFYYLHICIVLANKMKENMKYIHIIINTERFKSTNYILKPQTLFQNTNSLQNMKQIKKND